MLQVAPPVSTRFKSLQIDVLNNRGYVPYTEGSVKKIFNTSFIAEREPENSEYRGAVKIVFKTKDRNGKYFTHGTVRLGDSNYLSTHLDKFAAGAATPYDFLQVIEPFKSQTGTLSEKTKQRIQQGQVPNNNTAKDYLQAAKHVINSLYNRLEQREFTEFQGEPWDERDGNKRYLYMTYYDPALRENNATAGGRFVRTT